MSLGGPKSNLLWPGPVLRQSSLALATAEVIWIQSLLTELKVPHAPPDIFCDNISTVSLAHNRVLHSCTKHIELDLFFVREKVLRKQLQVVHVPAADQRADILTKALSPSNFVKQSVVARYSTEGRVQEFSLGNS